MASIRSCEPTFGVDEKGYLKLIEDYHITSRGGCVDCERLKAENEKLKKALNSMCGYNSDPKRCRDCEYNKECKE